MNTTIVKLYSDGRLAESIPLGNVEEAHARRILVDHVQQDSPEYTIASFRTHVVNRHQYMFVFLEPFRIDFVKFVNNLLSTSPKSRSIRDEGGLTSSKSQSTRDEDRQGYQQ